MGVPIPRIQTVYKPILTHKKDFKNKKILIKKNSKLNESYEDLLILLNTFLLKLHIL